MRTLTIAALALSAAVAVAAAAAEGPSTTLVFERLNRTFEDTVSEIAPIQKGPITVWPSSPHHRLTVMSHRLELSPRDDLHSLVVTMRFVGEADLVTRVETARVPVTLEDEVTIPEQERRIESVVRLERDALGEGFDITTVELPKHLRVTIESRLAGQIVTLCRTLTMFVLGDSGCGDLDEALANPNVGLPPPGSVYRLPDSELTPQERQQLLDYLEAARSYRSGAIAAPAAKL